MIEKIEVAALDLRRIVSRIDKKSLRLKIMIIKIAILKRFAYTYVCRKEVLIENLANDIPRLLEVASRIKPAAQRNSRDDISQERIECILRCIQQSDARI